MAGHVGVGALGAGHGGRHGGVELQLAVDGQVGHGSLGLGAGVTHLVHVLTLAGAQGGVAQEGNLGVDAEDLGGSGGLQGDLHQLILVGLDVDGAVTHGQDLAVTGSGGTDQNEAGGDDLAAGLGLDNLQGGTDSVGGGIGGAAQQSVGVAHLHQHGAKVVGLHQSVAALLLGHFAFAELHHGGDHLVHVLKGGGIDDDGAADVEADILGDLLDLLGVADQDGGQEGTGQQAGGSLQDAGVSALGEHDLAGMSLQLFDQKLKHVVFLQIISRFFA